MCVHSSVTRDSYRSMTRIRQQCDTYQKLYDNTMEISSISRMVDTKQTTRSSQLYFRTFIITFRVFFFRCLSLLFVYFSIIHVFLVCPIPAAITENNKNDEYVARKEKEMIASVTQHRRAHLLSGSDAFRAGEYKVQSFVTISMRIVLLC